MPGTPGIAYGRIPRRAAGSGAGRAAVDLATAVDGEEIVVPDLGKVLTVTRRFPAPRGLTPARRLHFDIEACGLTSAPLFLIGVMTEEAGDLLVRQFLARDYSEEAAVVRLFAEAAAAADQLVSFNGKSYDLPYIRTRAVATGVPFDLDPALPHLDLLHASRRAWKHRLPDCRLQTLETFILDKPRAPDIPGGEIPDAYHAFVRTGDARDLVKILDHNQVDLVTLAELLAKLEADT